MKDKMIEEYQPDYCYCLEDAYGKNFMSEGGTQAIDELFHGVDIKGKRLLDIGSGLGGAVFYLAQQHQCNIAGLEINPWMVGESTKRIPPDLAHLVDFQSYTPPTLPFSADSFDIIFSKGVLVHVADKAPLFASIHHALKPQGILIINDWLSPYKSWRKAIQNMCELEDLTLYPQTEQEYVQLLQDAGFTLQTLDDENPLYINYNRDVASKLKIPDVAENFISRFGKKSWQNSIIGYEKIAESMEKNELLVRRFMATK